MFNTRSLLFLATLFSLLSTQSFSQDSNFHIYLSFGQSNMEGQGTIESQDRTVDPRFQVLQSVTCSNLGRTKGVWYDAIPPLTRCWSGLSPADYFGRTLVENLPDSVRVGIINVSVAGARIELFDKENYKDYVDTITEDWLLNIIAEYDGNPYAHLVDLALQAQEVGVIKGILLHQGESNSGDNQWPAKVKVVYDHLLEDLGLDAETTPLLAGEVVHADQNGVVAGMNSIINQLPQTIPNAHIISSSQCTAADDDLHFDSAGYRELGRRYGLKMMEILEIQEFVNPVETLEFFLETECAVIGENWEILADTSASNGFYANPVDGNRNVRNAPTDSASTIIFPFEVDTTGFFNFYARMNNSTTNDDSFWFTIDDADFGGATNLVTDGWEWIQFANQKLDKGSHNLRIAIREDGLSIDKIAISNFEAAPTGKGAEALNSCSVTHTEDYPDEPFGFHLHQNYPNPFNPSTVISYQLTVSSEVTLEVFDALGRKVASLENGIRAAGIHQVNFDATHLSSGTYLVRLQVGDLVQTRTMTLIK
jgi:hypothetical protein